MFFKSILAIFSIFLFVSYCSLVSAQGSLQTPIQDSDLIGQWSGQVPGDHGALTDAIFMFEPVLFFMKRENGSMIGFYTCDMTTSPKRLVLNTYERNQNSNGREEGTTSILQAIYKVEEDMMGNGGKVLTVGVMQNSQEFATDFDTADLVITFSLGTLPSQADQLDGFFFGYQAFKNDVGYDVESYFIIYFDRAYFSVLSFNANGGNNTGNAMLGNVDLDTSAKHIVFNIQNLPDIESHTGLYEVNYNEKFDLHSLDIGFSNIANTAPTSMSEAKTIFKLLKPGTGVTRQFEGVWTGTVGEGQEATLTFYRNFMYLETGSMVIRSMFTIDMSKDPNQFDFVGIKVEYFENGTISLVQPFLKTAISRFQNGNQTFEIGMYDNSDEDPVERPTSFTEQGVNIISFDFSSGLPSDFPQLSSNDATSDQGSQGSNTNAASSSSSISSLLLLLAISFLIAMSF